MSNLQTSQPQELLRERDAVQRQAAWLLAGIILIAANLRTPLTALTPLVELIRGDIPISGTMAGLLTTLPLLAFAALSPFVPRMARDFGMEHTLFAALIAMLAGSLIREIGSEFALLAGTVVTGLGIAAGNVMLPALIKKQFPLRIGLVTGFYSIAMNSFAATASAVSVPIAKSTDLGWRGTLLTITLVGALAILAWLPQLKYNDRTVSLSANAKTTAEPNGRLDARANANAEHGANLNTAARKPSVWRSRLAWQITLFMGLQSFIFYVFVAWLPNMLQDQGMSDSQSGYMLSLLQVGLIPFAFIVPIVAGRLKNQLGLLMFTCVFYGLGFAGLMTAHGHAALTMVSVIALGAAGGTSFSLAMMFFSLRTRTAREASEISGMAQSIGYLLAAAGPFAFGLLHDAVHDWTVPMLLLVAATFALLLAGLAPARGAGYVFPKEADPDRP